MSAHNTPSDLAAMALEDLMQLRVDDIALRENSWIFRVNYVRRVQQGMLRGSDNIADEAVLWDRVSPRTEYNFPVIATRVEQQAMQFAVSREINNDYSFSATVAHLKQATDHSSIVANYERFIIETSGMSDTELTVTRHQSKGVGVGLDYSLGLSLPTGSIDEKGDTPRGPGNQIVPYNMQLGSGTFDVPIGVSCAERLNDIRWGASVNYRWRLGRNSKGYRLGDELQASAWASYRFSGMTATVGFNYQHKDDLVGENMALRIEQPMGFVYPVSFTNPRFYGGEQYSVRFGFKRQFVWSDETVEIGAAYRYLLHEQVNGIQLAEQDRFEFSLNYYH